MTTKTYPIGKRYLCDSCKSVSQFPVEISAEDIPVELTCPHCKTVTRWEGYLPILPKIPPAVTEQRYALFLWEVKKQVDTCFNDDLEPVSENPQESATGGRKEGEVIPFWKLSTDLGVMVKELFEKTNLMKEEIVRFQETLGKYFLHKWNNASRFSQNWHSKYLQEFLEWPFTAIPIRCDDALAGQYGRWVLAPKFYDPGIGIKLNLVGGFRLELINAYTRMMFPLETEWCSYLDVPPPLDLEVIDNKIVGPSLPFCWRDIPGLVEDKDHTEEWTSVYMAHCMEARLWLAQHGVSPWGKRSIELSELDDRVLEPEISKHKAFLKAWKCFCERGRLAVFWPSVMESRKFAFLASVMLKGITCVFVASHRDEMVWRNLYETYDHPYSLSKLVYFHNDTPAIWDAILQSKSVVIDMANGTDTAILDQFFNYHGRLMIINADPVLDFFTSNLVIAKVFALTGSQVFEDAHWQNWPSRHIQDLDIYSTFCNLGTKISGK